MQVIALEGFPFVKRGADIGGLIARAADKQSLMLEDGDVVVVTQSIVSKAEGCVVDLDKVKPSEFAKRLAKQLNKDPREMEVILHEAKEIVRLRHVLVARTHHGFVCASAGVDHSNVDHGKVTLLPSDPDASARRIRRKIKQECGVDVAVIITDTQGRAFRMGALGTAIGLSGIKPLMHLRGRRDLYGRKLRSKVIAVADALAAAGVAVIGEADEGTPVAVIKGATYEKGEGSVSELIRPREKDLFV
jgi:coenzyme F420-0:L-glutamate ligase/coenzyme F420-1:gamma-L-glutamate ligase